VLQLWFKIIVRIKMLLTIQ